MIPSKKPMTIQTIFEPDVEDREVIVDLAERSYSIHIGSDLLRRAGDLIAPLLARPVTAIVTDENVASHHLAVLEGVLADAGITATSIVLPAGERTKSFAHLERLCDELLDAASSGATPSSPSVAASSEILRASPPAVLRRGVDFIQIPTSLLAQVDSSVGGKTGVNASAGKNLIGAFHQPKTRHWPTSMSSTPCRQRELSAGYAEVAKYGLIADAEFYGWLEANGADIIAGSRGARARAIETSCRAKAAIVAKDEREGGIRALLNLGHTFGHALEAVTGYSGRLLHGEGVAIGMVLAHRFSESLGHARAGGADRIADHLSAIGLPVSPRDIEGELPGPQTLLEIMRQDKKTVAGKLTFILTRDIGDAFVASDVAEHDVLAFLENNANLK